MSKSISTVTIPLEDYEKLRENENALALSNELYELAKEASRIDDSRALYEWQRKVEEVHKSLGYLPAMVPARKTR